MIPTYNLATFFLQQERIDEAQTLFQTTLDLQNGDNLKTRSGLLNVSSQKRNGLALIEVDRIIQTTENLSNNVVLRDASTLDWNCGTRLKDFESNT